MNSNATIGSLWLFAAIGSIAGVGIGPARADVVDGPEVSGPDWVGAATASLREGAYEVRFGEGGRTAHVRFRARLEPSAGGIGTLWFGGNGIRAVHATLDGVPVAVEEPADGSEVPPEAAMLPVHRLVSVALVPGTAARLEVAIECDTLWVEREPLLTHPQASFLLNWRMDGGAGRGLDLGVGSAVAGPASVSVETTTPHRVRAGFGGDPEATATGERVVGTVAAGERVALEASEREGETPRDWGILVGIGLAFDWPRSERTVRDATGAVTERWIETRDPDDPVGRIWFRGLFQYAFSPNWLFGTGLEGDFKGVMEIPFVFTWFPQEGRPGRWDVLADYRFLFGAAVQIFNDGYPDDYDLDPRLFLRVGGGVRLLLLTIEAAYEISPPLGPWDHDRLGGLEHKFTLTFPWTF
jgi:hypothetical protein